LDYGLDWCSDWKEDVEAGIALGHTYEHIGELVHAHYLEAFRHLDSNGSNLFSSCQSISTSFTWTEDWRRGLDLVESYSQLAEIISNHYANLFEERIGAPPTLNGNINNQNHDRHQQNDSHFNDYQLHTCVWNHQWEKYTSAGQDLSEYYRNKCLAIIQYYLDGVLQHFDDDSLESSSSSNSLMLQEEFDEEQLIAKGKAVGNYYSAVFDPFYRVNTLSRLPNHSPDRDFPRWGVNHKADQEHGIALGEYWKQCNDVMKAYYDSQGPDLVRHYQSYFSDVFFGIGEYSSLPDKESMQHRDDDQDQRKQHNDDIRHGQHSRQMTTIIISITTAR
jgi:hypothetical protein